MTKVVTISLRDDQVQRLNEFAERAGKTSDQLLSTLIDTLLPPAPALRYTAPCEPRSSLDLIGSLPDVELVESNEEIDWLIADEAAGAGKE